MLSIFRTLHIFQLKVKIKFFEEAAKIGVGGDENLGYFLLWPKLSRFETESIYE